jgi:hypothetical protein
VALQIEGDPSKKQWELHSNRHGIEADDTCGHEAEFPWNLLVNMIIIPMGGERMTPPQTALTLPYQNLKNSAGIVWIPTAALSYASYRQEVREDRRQRQN